MLGSSQQFEGEAGSRYIDESEVLTPADEFVIWKWINNTICKWSKESLVSALRRIEEGVPWLEQKGEPGTGNVVGFLSHPY